MSAVIEKALWLIEHRYGEDLSLDDIASHCGVSRFYLSRRFPAATGFSVTAYLRARRLTEAAKALAAGAPDILDVALIATYGSHEAFTRAFRDQFGMTPEQLRALGSTDGIALVEAIRYDATPFIDLPPPEIAERPPLLLAGLSERHPFNKPQEVPAQWQRFNPFIGTIANAREEAAYGVVSDARFGADGFQYTTAVAVTRLGELPPELKALRLAAGKFARFRYRGHVSKMRAMVHTIFNRDLDLLGIEPGEFPSFVEYYGPDFDPDSGDGQQEIWVPLKP
jgi:AraC family transcriptional regulator